MGVTYLLSRCSSSHHVLKHREEVWWRSWRHNVKVALANRVEQTAKRRIASKRTTVASTQFLKQVARVTFDTRNNKANGVAKRRRFAENTLSILVNFIGRIQLSKRKALMYDKKKKKNARETINLVKRILIKFSKTKKVFFF